jgi:hypothetical protein
MPKITSQDFVLQMNDMLNNFKTNIDALGQGSQTEYAWMEMFLRWAEWSDDTMRPLYWGQDTCHE